MPFSGDLGALGQLTRNLGKLAKVPSRIASEGSERIANLIDEEFESETDPNGRAWEALAESTINRKYGDSRILQRSGDMRGSVDVRTMSGTGISITINDEAGFHQGGTVNMPARPVLPGTTFPAKWNEALEDLANEAFDEAVGE